LLPLRRGDRFRAAHQEPLQCLSPPNGSTASSPA
jgi:hypothetical protein